MATETIILNLEVDQGQALSELKATEKAIESLKKEQKELNQAYKEGTISQDQYIDENLKLQQSIKKETDQKKTLIKAIDTEKGSRDAMRQRISQLTKEYNSLNTTTDKGRQRSAQLAAELKKLNGELNKGSKEAGSFKDNIGNYTESIKEAASNTNVAGVSVGSLGTKMASLANPITATIALVGALGAAYAKSSTGARDLEFAQARISSTVSILIEDFGKLVGGGGGGKGIFSQLVSLTGDYYKTLINVASFGMFNDYLEKVAKKSKDAADAQQRLNDLSISGANAKGFSKEDERNAEIQRRIRDDEEQSLAKRLAASEKIDQFMKSSGLIRIAVLQAEAAELEAIAKASTDRRQLDVQIAEKLSEVKDIEEQIEGKLTENKNARKEILKTTREQIEVQRKAAQEEANAMRRGSSGAIVGIDTIGIQAGIDTTLAITQAGFDAELSMKERLANDIIKINQQIADSNAATAQQSADFAINQQNRQLDATQQSIDNIASIFDQGSEAYKALAITQNSIDTFRAATAALSPPPTGAGPLFGPILAATTIAAGIANGIRIAGFAEGGFTGSGFGVPDSSGFKPAGIVHQDEYVVPKWQVNSPSFAPLVGQLESGRIKGYADGGLVSSSITSPINQEMMLSNALKRMPIPIISVKEVTTVQNRIKLRERGSKI